MYKAVQSYMKCRQLEKAASNSSDEALAKQSHLLHNNYHAR